MMGISMGMMISSPSCSGVSGRSILVGKLRNLSRIHITSFTTATATATATTIPLSNYATTRMLLKKQLIAPRQSLICRTKQSTSSQQQIIQIRQLHKSHQQYKHTRVPKTSNNNNNKTMRSSATTNKFKSVSKKQHRIRKKSTKSAPTTATGPLSSSSSSSSSTTTKMNQLETTFTSLKKSLQYKLLQPRVVPIPRWISPRSYSFTISECFGHGSFILVAISYATDDFLLLRLIAVAGSTSMLFFTYFHPHGRVLWLPFQWNLLFIFINSYRIIKSVYYQYVGHYLLSQDMKRVKDEYFAIMEMSDFAKLCSIAQEESFKDGEMIVFQGQKNPHVRVVIEGELDVLRDGIKTYNVSEGNFVTEAGLHAGLYLTGAVESCATIVAPPQQQRGGVEDDENNNEPKKVARCLRWDRTELIELLDENPGMLRSLKAILSWDIVRKLKGQRQAIALSKVDDPKIWTQKRQEQSEDRYAAILQNMLQHPEYFQKRKSELDHYRMVHVSRISILRI
jgi:CRP-like cAMP-binding protein